MTRPTAIRLLVSSLGLVAGTVAVLLAALLVHHAV
jgi:hypothetical protein